jgi:prepilin-type N-terminal cleavage/methylation domain-containing protein/prepilin-type processing-associated H-X9-DG protein
MVATNRRGGGFTLIEILVVIAIIAVLIAILIPVAEKVRESALANNCLSNLRQIGQAISIYANENHGAYPRTLYGAGIPLTKGTNPAAPDPFGIGGPEANDVTAPLFLLMRTQHLPPVLFTCPYTDVNVYEADSALNVTSRSNFTNWKKNLGYSYANPYPADAATRAGYKLTSNMNPALAIMADLNSGETGKANSDNHEDRGQNVLFADGHGTWEKTPLCGLNGDNIYTTKGNLVWASPVDAGDSVLLPAKK